MTTLSKAAYKALYGSSGTTFADNTTQDISEGDLRQFGEDTADSFTVSGGLNWTVVQIGDWDMDSTSSISVAHGISDYTKIRLVTCFVRADGAGATTYDLSRGGDLATDNNLQGWVAGITSANILLYRFTGGVFDGTSFKSTSYNRGWITIGYVD